MEGRAGRSGPPDDPETSGRRRGAPRTPLGAAARRTTGSPFREERAVRRTASAPAAEAAGLRGMVKKAGGGGPARPRRGRRSEPAPAEAGRRRLVRVVRTGASCPCTKARCGVFGSSSGPTPPRRTDSRPRPDRPASDGQPRKPHRAHASIVSPGRCSQALDMEGGDRGSRYFSPPPRRRSSVVRGRFEGVAGGFHPTELLARARRPGNAGVPPASIGGGLAVPFAGGTQASGRRAVPRTPCPRAFASGAPGENPTAHMPLNS